jgi:adenosine kinase
MQPLLSGSLAVDQIMSFDGLYEDMIQPEKLHVLSISMLIQELKRTQGGIAGNIAYSLALLGETPILFSSIGEDQRAYMEKLAKMGVDISAVHFSQLPSATFTVLTDRNDCQVGGFYPGAMSDASSLSIEKFADKDVFVVISAHDPAQMKKQVAECKKLGKRLFYDVGQQAINIAGEDIREGIEAAELLIVNDYEMGILVQKTGWSEVEIRAKVKTCVVTLGEKGCEIFQGEKKESVGVCAVDKMVDPTGAGDAFRAGFVYGYLRGWELKNCAQLGAVVASFAIEQVGTQEHHFTPTELSARHESAFHEPLSF